MDKNLALREVEGLGSAYFYDPDAEMTNEEIIAQIRGHILSTRKLTGLIFWKNKRDALGIVLAECSEERLDQVMKSYNLPLRDVGGHGRNLLERLYQVIAEAIQEQEKVLQSL